MATSSYFFLYHRKHIYDITYDINFLCLTLYNQQYPFGYISVQNLQAYRNNRLLYLINDIFLEDSNLTVPLNHK